VAHRVRPVVDAAARRLLPAVVLPEVDHLLGDRLGRAARQALYGVVVTGVYEVIDLDPSRWARVQELDRQFEDLELGLVDAAVAALAEQLGVRRLATTDHRPFSTIAGEVALTLLP
jgi:uncharacterized protein